MIATIDTGSRADVARGSVSLFRITGAGVGHRVEANARSSSSVRFSTRRSVEGKIFLYRSSTRSGIVCLMRIKRTIMLLVASHDRPKMSACSVADVVVREAGRPASRQGAFCAPRWAVSGGRRP